MLQKFGIENVRSRFMSETTSSAAAIVSPPTINEAKVKRSASIANRQKPAKTEMSKTTYPKNVGTPKNSLRNRLNEVKEYDEKLEDERKQKELKNKKEAAERIKKKQEDYLKSLVEKKRLESEKEDEERRRQEQLKQNLRAKVKGMLDGLEKKPKAEEEEEEDKDKDTKKLEPHDFENFLKRNLQKKKVFVNITDFDYWKKKHKLEAKEKVFILTGGYAPIRKALLKRGWFENKDPNSPCFDLKWTLRARDVDHGHLQDFQIVNHFHKSAAITTKVGLCHSLKNLIWFNNVDVDTFYPQCFDFKDKDDFEEFVENFKSIKAETIVKKFAYDIEEVEMDSLKMSIKVCERRLMDLDDIIDMKNPPKCLVSDEEWEIIAKDELNDSRLAKKKHNDWLKKMDCWSVAQYPTKKNKDKKNKANASKSKKSKIGDTEIDMNNKEELKERCTEICDRLKEKFFQFELNGIHNIWIVKPAGLSRGRGIQVFASLVEILDNCHKEGQWVAQKYIENPMIIQGRKFDIRQWVLVTSWNPLTIWFWNKPYIRFPAADYDPNNLNDRFVHLTNNAIAKFAKNSVEIGQGNMWFIEEFAEHLQQEYGEDVWENSLRKNMQQVVKNSLEAVQDMFDENNTKGTCTELYGFDLMIDDKCNPWLIEVNASPCMEPSTPVTEKLCADVLEDTIKVIVDYHYARKKSKIDTGDWQLICKKKVVECNQVNSCGLNFVCEGTRMKVKKQKGGTDKTTGNTVKEADPEMEDQIDDQIEEPAEEPPTEEYDEVKPESDDEKYDRIGQEFNIENNNINDEVDNDVDDDDDIDEEDYDD